MKKGNPISINFGFENCEYAEIPIEYVESFHFRQCYTTKGYRPHGQGSYTYDVIDYLEILFKDSFNEYSYPMLGDIDEKNLVKERLKKYPDICWFGFKFEDGSEENYQVKWQIDHPYENEGQSYSEDGLFGDVLIIGQENDK